MTDQKPCLPGCQWRPPFFFKLDHDHGCLSAEQPAPKVEHGRLCGCAQCWRESYEAQIPKPAPTPAPASVPPASDEEIADTKARAVRVTAIGSVRALKLIARIEQEQAANAELRAQVKRCHALLQGFVSCTDPEAEPELCGDASKELGGEFCPGSCTTSCDADRDVDRAEIASLRARLAEVKAATRRVNMAAFDLYSDILPAVKALEAILAKGDK